MTISNGHPVVIAGGGPAGATMGAYLSMAGIENVILEAACHPRPHVGESMVTATTRIFDEIGFLPTLEREGFPHKYGASWHPIEGRQEFRIAFREFPQPGIHQDHTYHMDRSRFDLLLLKHAEALGSKVIQGVRVRDCLYEEGRATGVTVDIAGSTVNLPAAMVVDATGREALIGRKLGLKQKDPIFDQYAVHAWYEGVNRGRGESQDYIHIYFLPVKMGWAWQIPITDRVTSIGVVAEREVFRESNADVASYMDQMIRSNPSLAEAMAGARRTTELKREGNYSYSVRRFSGPGFVIVGDAARFVDPIFSSGVSVAMHSSKFAAEAIRAVLHEGADEEKALAAYEAKLKRGVEIWYEFIQLYYSCLPIFTRFIQHPDYRLNLLQLLQGDVYDREEVPVLQAMRDAVEVVRQTEDHLLRPAYRKLA